MAFLLLFSIAKAASATSCTAVTGSCAKDGSSNYISRSLTYDTNTGIFTGSIVTNICPDFAYGVYPGLTQTYGAAMPSCSSFSFPSVSGTPKAASLRGAVGYSFNGGVNIYGPMDNGFVNGQVCAGTCDAGTDVMVCSQYLQNQCGSTFKPQMFLDQCGGHAQPYHFHTDLACNYIQNATGHSALIGIALDGRGIYGMKESSYSYPTDLDYCGGHYGPVPAYTIGGVTYPAASNVYHYHTQPVAPWTVGCFGPVTTLNACKALYPSTCGTGTSSMTGLFSNGSVCSYSYDTDCPCYGKGLVYDNNQQCGVATTIAAAVTLSSNLYSSSSTTSSTTSISTITSSTTTASTGTTAIISTTTTVIVTTTASTNSPTSGFTTTSTTTTTPASASTTSASKAIATTSSTLSATSALAMTTSSITSSSITLTTDLPSISQKRDHYAIFFVFFATALAIF